MKGSLYNHPRVVWLLLLFILVTGVNAFKLMPRLEDPHMQSRVIQILTVLPGADAERIESEITEKLERKIQEISEVKRINSASRPNISFITVELDDAIYDSEAVMARLRDKIGEITDFPEGASQPRLDNKAVYGHALVVALEWVADSPVNYAIMGRHAKELESQLRNLNGTDFVDVTGLPKEEFRVTLDDVKLSAHGLTVADVAARVAQSDARGTAGNVEGGKNSMPIEVAGALDSLARIERIPLGFDKVGAALRLGDVATITRAYENPVSNFAFLNGHYGIAISTRMLEDQRIDKYSVSLAALLEDYSKVLPSAIKLETIFDQADYANARLSGLMGNLGIGALVVVTVLMFSLGMRAALISASILPLTLLSALAILNFSDMRIEQVMVTGMIVALGIMVDNAIVITDEIQQLLLKGERRAVAVSKTIRKLWLPLLGSTLTTIIAFMPLMLMPGNAGDFMIGVPAAVIAALISSYIIAFTIIAALAGRVIRGTKSAEDYAASSGTHRIWWRDGVNAPIISGLFERSLRWSVANPLRSMGVAFAVPLVGFYLASHITEQFFPISDRDQFVIEVDLPGQATIEETRKAVLQMHDIVQAKSGVESAYWYAGGKRPKFYYSLISKKEGVPSYAEAMVNVTDYAVIPKLIPELQRELTFAFPAATIFVKPLDTGPPVQAPIEVRIVGPVLSTLEEVGNQVRQIIGSVPSVIHTTASISASRPQVIIDAKEDSVSVTGLTLRQMAGQINALTNGIVATHVYEDIQPIPVKLIVGDASRSSINSIQNLNLRGGDQLSEADRSFKDVPVSALGNVRLGSKVGVIARRNGERVNTVRGYLKFGVLPEEGFQEVQRRIEAANFKLPAGYRLEWGGENEERGEAVAQLAASVGSLMVLMLICLVLTFNSFRLAIVTIFAAAQAAGLGLMSLWFADFPLSFVVLIGLSGLIGLAINAAIVILSELRGMEAARAGNRDAIVEGVMKTGRHIISTTLTTVGGFMPLILAGGQFWPPFAVAIAGGAFLSMIVSFYFAPAAFLWLTRRKEISRPKNTEEIPLSKIAPSNASQ